MRDAINKTKDDEYNKALRRGYALNIMATTFFVFLLLMFFFMVFNTEVFIKIIALPDDLGGFILGIIIFAANIFFAFNDFFSNIKIITIKERAFIFNEFNFTNSPTLFGGSSPDDTPYKMNTKLKLLYPVFLILTVFFTYLILNNVAT